MCPQLNNDFYCVVANLVISCVGKKPDDYLAVYVRVYLSFWLRGLKSSSPQSQLGLQMLTGNYAITSG